jgi:hypothetical protein
MDGEFYRGGNSLRVRPRDIRTDPYTGLLTTDRGVSVSTSPDGLDRFGGAHCVTNVPPELHVVQRGANPNHHEIAPAHPMTLDEYREALAKIVLVPATGPGGAP